MSPPRCVTDWSQFHAENGFGALNAHPNPERKHQNIACTKREGPALHRPVALQVAQLLQGFAGLRGPCHWLGSGCPFRKARFLPISQPTLE